jgi:hypothetical protein
MTEPKFPWALLVMLGMFGFVAFSPKSPPWVSMGGFVAAAIIAVAAIYQLIPRRDDSLDWEKTPGEDADETDSPTS